MINKLLKSFFFKQKMTLKRYSILRILQIEELIKLNIKGSVLDVGGTVELHGALDVLLFVKFHVGNTFRPPGPRVAAAVEPPPIGGPPALAGVLARVHGACGLIGVRELAQWF